MAATCQHKKPDGSSCKGATVNDSSYCAYHHKKTSNGVTHGNRSKAQTLGISPNEQLTFEEFHALNKPFELNTELAYLRTLLVEIRKSMESQRDTSRDTFFEDLHERTLQFLLEANMKPAVAEKITNSLHPVWTNIIEAYYGPADPLQPEQFMMLGDLIEKIARTAEKAKKIQEGITLNIEFKNIGQILTKFVREVLFAVVRDPLPPTAIQLRQEIVTAVRTMNLTGQTVKALPPAQVVDDYA